MEAILIKIDGTKRKIKINTFVEARGIVCNYDQNGTAEIITLSDGKFLMIDEEGKRKNYQINSVATGIAHLEEGIYPHDCIVGDVILFEDANEFDELDYE
jgi:hypothetical protein